MLFLLKYNHGCTLLKHFSDVWTANPGCTHSSRIWVPNPPSYTKTHQSSSASVLQIELLYTSVIREISPNTSRLAGHC